MSSMIDSILEKLFYGDINVNECFSPERDSLFQDEKAAYKKREEAFHDKLPLELRTEFEELVTGAIEFVAMENVVYFKEGCRIGARLMMELLKD